jgi:hypothetical protein
MGFWVSWPSSLDVSSAKVIFYQHVDYGGAAWTLEPGKDDQGAMLQLGIPNDEISSKAVHR